MSLLLSLWLVLGGIPAGDNLMSRPPGITGPGVVPPCSNSMDFTKACNSLYVGVIL